MSRPKHIKETAFEFLARTISEHNSDRCLIWPFYCDPRHGYGILNTPFTKNVQKAHRVAYLLTYGEWPEPLGRHMCNNPPCYNPRHIVPGTDADNAADCVRAGRHYGFPRGAANPATKVNAELAALIQQKCLTLSRKAAAKQLGISHTTVLRVLRGAHMTAVQPRPHGEKHKSAKLTESDVIAIRGSEERVTDLARRYCVSDGAITGIKSGAKWKHLSHTPLVRIQRTRPIKDRGALQHPGKETRTSTQRLAAN